MPQFTPSFGSARVGAYEQIPDTNTNLTVTEQKADTQVLANHVLKLQSMLSNQPEIKKSHIKPQVELIMRNMTAIDENQLLALIKCAETVERNPRSQFVLVSVVAQGLEQLIQKRIPSGTELSPQLLQDKLPQLSEIMSRIRNIDIAKDPSHPAFKATVDLVSVFLPLCTIIGLPIGMYGSWGLVPGVEALLRKFAGDKTAYRFVYGKASNPHLSNEIWGDDFAPGHSFMGSNLVIQATAEVLNRDLRGQRKSSNAITLMSRDYKRLNIDADKNRVVK